MTLDAEDISARIDAWTWIPDEATTVETDEFLLIAYPAHYSDPTVALRLRSERPADDLIDDVLVRARELGRDAVAFYNLDERTRPTDLEQRLRGRGAAHTETLAVLARDLTTGLPDLAVPEGLDLRRIATADDLLAMERLDAEVFGATLRPAAQVVADFERQGPDPGVVLAWRDGVLVGAAGHTVAGDSLRLWGGAVAEAARHTGVYRALLDHRLRAGLAEGCRVALVKGRVGTSAPVLLRAGFERFGEVRAYLLQTRARSGSTNEAVAR